MSDYANITAPKLDENFFAMQDMRGVQVCCGERRALRGAPQGAAPRQLLPQPRIHAAKEAAGETLTVIEINSLERLQ